MQMNELITRLKELDDKVAEYNKLAKETKQEYDELAKTTLFRLDEQGMTKASAGNLTVSKSTSVVPQVVDWQEFYNFITENEAFYMLEKRAAVSAYREMIQLGREVPGVVPFEKTSLKLTKST